MLLRPRTKPTHARRGAALVELAAVLPLFVILLIGIWDISRLAQMQQIVSNACREGGRQASTGRLTIAQTREVMRLYLEKSGLTTTGVVTEGENVTRGGDFTTAQRYDELRTLIRYPYANNRWNVMNFFVAPGAYLNCEYRWRNLADIPIAINDLIPTAPRTPAP